MDSSGKVAYVDDTSRINVSFAILSTLVCGCSKEGQAFLGESEHSVEVQRQNLGPSLVLSTPPNLDHHQGRLERGTYARGKRRTSLPKRLQRC